LGHLFNVAKGSEIAVFTGLDDFSAQRPRIRLANMPPTVLVIKHTC
jgi:hypothetical protein